MEIPKIPTNCNEAKLTHFRLQIEASEIEGLASNDAPISGYSTTDSNTRLDLRAYTLDQGMKSLVTTLDACEACDLVDTKNEVACPSMQKLGFIRVTLVK